MNKSNLVITVCLTVLTVFTGSFCCNAEPIDLETIIVEISRAERGDQIVVINSSKESLATVETKVRQMVNRLPKGLASADIYADKTTTLGDLIAVITKINAAEVAVNDIYISYRDNGVLFRIPLFAKDAEVDPNEIRIGPNPQPTKPVPWNPPSALPSASPTGPADNSTQKELP